MILLSGPSTHSRTWFPQRSLFKGILRSENNARICAVNMPSKMPKHKRLEIVGARKFNNEIWYISRFETVLPFEILVQFHFTPRAICKNASFLFDDIFLRFSDFLQCGAHGALRIAVLFMRCIILNQEHTAIQKVILHWHPVMQCITGLDFRDLSLYKQGRDVNGEGTSLREGTGTRELQSGQRGTTGDDLNLDF